MNPAHAVLRNVDILHIVCESILSLGPIPTRTADRRMELLSFALVCRLISNVALDVLWGEFENFEDLYFLFSADIVTTDPEGRKSFKRLIPTAEEWSRFDIYASRIRTLSVSFASTHNDNQVALCEALMRRPRRGYLFPGLKHLKWHGKPWMVSKAGVLLSPNLYDILLTFDGKENNAAAAEIVRDLRSTCRALKCFSCHWISPWDRRSLRLEIEDSLISLFHSHPHLQTVSIPASYKVLEALGHLPSLSSLSLHDVHRKDWLSPRIDFPGGHQPPDTNAFSALEYLHLDITSDLRALHFMTGYFQDVEQPLRVSLRVAIKNDRRSTKELAKHLHDVLYPNLKIGLRRFRITYMCWQNVTRDSWQLFSWLLSSRRLTELSLGGFCLDIDDSDLEQMVRAWQEMEILHIVPKKYESQITFRGLVHLSALPKLRDISVMLAPDCSIAPLMLIPESFPPSKSPLEMMDISGGFPSVLPLQVQLFMAGYFPNLSDITGYGETEEKWAEVQAGVNVLREIAAATSNHCYLSA